MTVITHLFFAKSVQNIAGTKEKHIGDSPEKIEHLNQNKIQSDSAPLVITPALMQTRRVQNVNVCLIKEKPPDLYRQTKVREGAKQATPKSETRDQPGSVILSFLLREKPPDAPCITKSPRYQGKTLASQNRMKANLLSLDADCTVSRSKLFQGRGYDADIQTTPYQEQTIPTGSSLKPTIPWQFGELLPKWSFDQAQGLGLIIHQQITPKKTNDSGRINNPRANSPYRHEDPPGACRNQVDRVNEDFSRPILNIHQETAYFMRNDRETFSHYPSESRDYHGGPKPGVNKETCEPKVSLAKATTWRPSRRIRGFPFNPGSRPHSSPRVEDRKQQVRSTLALFGRVHTYVHTQRLFHHCCCVLETFYTFQRLPRTPGFMPKLSRYKEPSNFPFWPDFVIKAPTAIFFKFCDSFLVLASLDRCLRAYKSSALSSL